MIPMLSLWMRRLRDWGDHVARPLGDSGATEEETARALMLTPERLDQLRRLNKMPDLYERLANALAYSIYEHEDIKKGSSSSFFPIPCYLPALLSLYSFLSSLHSGLWLTVEITPVPDLSQLIAFMSSVSLRHIRLLFKVFLFHALGERATITRRNRLYFYFEIESVCAWKSICIPNCVNFISSLNN